VAALVLPLGGPDHPAGPAGGVLAVRCGASAQPFSPLRRRIATQLVQTAGTVLAVVLAREKVEQQLSDTRLQLGRDALTDVGSRHRWDSELAAAQGLVDAGVPVAVALLDLDDLKHVNDTYGHTAGDELLRTCGAALRACLRGSSDVVARVGGDEFAVLVPRVGDVEALAARLRAGVEQARTPGGLPLRVSVGVARAEPGRTVARAVTEADAAMYEDKRRRRALRTSAGERPGRA
jgi:diguanylate cyclase (GGDEF)-like protein